MQSLFVYVVSEMDQKSGNNYVLRCMLLIKRLIVLVVGKDGGEGRSRDSNFQGLNK